MSKIYKIEHTALWLNVITVFAVSFIGFIVMIILVFRKTFDGNFYWLPPFFVFPFAVGGFLAGNIFGTYEIVVSFTETGLNIKRKDKFLLKGYTVFTDWNQIKSFFIGREGVFQIFKFYTRNGKKFRITHSRYSNDDFEMFCNQFLNKINEINESNVYCEPITVVKAIYEKPVAGIIAALFVIMMIAIPFLLWFYKPDIEYILVFFFYAYAIFFIRQFIVHNKSIL